MRNCLTEDKTMVLISSILFLITPTPSILLQHYDTIYLKNEFANITIYDMLGNVINNLVNDNQNSGYKSVQWDAINNQGQPVSAGVYLCSIEAGDFETDQER